MIIIAQGSLCTSLVHLRHILSPRFALGASLCTGKLIPIAFKAIEVSTVQEL